MQLAATLKAHNGVREDGAEARLRATDGEPSRLRVSE